MENNGANNGTIPDNIKLPEEKEYYTVAEIIEQAKRIYDFSCSKATDKKRYDRVKKKISRGLDDKNAIEDTTAGKTYPREIVYNLLNDKLRKYFLELSDKFNEEDAAKREGEGKPDKAAEAKERAKRARAKIQAIRSVSQTRAEYIKNIAALYDSTDGDIEDDIELFINAEIEKAKHDIFFQYLFDALISFRAKEYEDDLRSLPAPDDMNPSDAEIEAIARLRDLHHYYTPKVDLTALLRSLYKGP